MAVDPSSSADPGAAAPAGPRRNKGIALGGGITGLIGLAWALAIVALPANHGSLGQKHRIEGPFVIDVSPSAGFQVNLAGDGGKHYLSLNLKVEVDAFEESYAGARVSQPLYQAKLTDAILRTAAQKTKSELDNAVGREVFRDELRQALDPVLFPVHVGDEHAPDGAHAASGLRPGLSCSRSNLRGLYYDHVLEVDAPRKLLRLDDGEETHFNGDETDLFVSDPRGRGVYVDVSGFHPEFVGKVQVGTFGRVRNVYFDTLLTQ